MVNINTCSSTDIATFKSLKEHTERQGVYLGFSYLGPRKRITIPAGVSGDTFESAMIKAKQYIAQKRGKFIKGYAMACTFHDSEDHNGNIHTMQSVAIYSPRTALTQEEIASLNA